jgi:hypothetical protein
MKIWLSKKSAFSVISFILIFASQTIGNSPELPNPVLVFMGIEYFQEGATAKARYLFDIFNKEDYPAELFAAAPKLPPCGVNQNASRTWVDIYDENGKRLNGFCALGKPSDLSKLWFALDSNVIPPSWVYIELTDRETNKKYKSNLAETTL